MWQADNWCRDWGEKSQQSDSWVKGREAQLNLPVERLGQEGEQCEGGEIPVSAFFHSPLGWHAGLGGVTRWAQQWEPPHPINDAPAKRSWSGTEGAA